MPFPNSPSLGATHTENGTTYVYTSYGWQRSIVAAGNETTYTGGGGGSATATGNAGEIQYTDGTNLAASNKLKWDSVNSELEVIGDVQLLDGGTYTTTLQTITPTANRTISLPDATGTVALVGGSSGQLIYNNAGVNAGASTLTYDGSILTTSGRFINSYNSGSLAPAKTFTGTWATNAGATNTKPHVLIETTGATSNNWSNSGTGLGVNAASGFVGNLLDLQVNGSRKFRFDPNGNIWGDGTNANLKLADASGSILSYGPTGGIIGQVFVGYSLRLQSDDGVTISDAASSRTAKLFVEAASNQLAQRNGTNAQTFRVYNTYTSSTNYELGKLEWNSNVFRIGTEKGSGGGTARTVEVHTDSIARLALDTTGSVRVVTGLTVATLPGTPAVGMIARVTDATAPAVGSTVAGGGAAAALVWYNGTNWTVIGV